MTQKLVRIKPSIQRYLINKILFPVVVWIIVQVGIQAFNSPFDTEAVIFNSIGGTLGITTMTLLTFSYSEITLTTHSITGPSGWWGKASIPYEKVDVEASVSHNDYVRFYQNYQIRAENGDKITVDSSFSAQQIKNIMNDIVKKQEELKEQATR